MSEKMDGQYMYWGGHGNQMYARGRGGRGDANPQNPPSSFLNWLPKNIALEGELAHHSGEASRGQQAKKDGWKNACFFVFDAPEMEGPYVERIAHLKSLEKGWNKRYVRVVPQLGTATSHAVMVQALKTVVKRGGEGLMIRDPQAPYQFCDPNNSKSKRTKSLFKFKPFEDCEAKVLGLNASGCRGYQCVLPNGIEFGLSSLNGIRCGKVGTIINITCQGFLANGKPQYPKAQSVRTDRPWKDYVRAWKMREGAQDEERKEKEKGEAEATEEETEEDTGEAEEKEDDKTAQETEQVPCRYGAKCFRKNAAHQRKYSHPMNEEKEKEGEEAEEVVDTNDQSKPMACLDETASEKTEAEATLPLPRTPLFKRDRTRVLRRSLRKRTKRKALSF